MNVITNTVYCVANMLSYLFLEGQMARSYTTAGPIPRHKRPKSAVPRPMSAAPAAPVINGKSSDGVM